MRDLLFEIGMEEIPAGFLLPALNLLKQKCAEKFFELKIDFSEVCAVGTPRRLAIIAHQVAEKQQDLIEEFLGPSKAAGFDKEGKPTKAAEGFARSKGADPNELKIVQTPKGDYLMLSRPQKGKATITLLPEILKNLILEMTFPKSMRWGSNKHPFARPIQWIVALFGEEVIAFSHEGIETSARSGGHRFLASEKFTVQSAANYQKQLDDRYVVVDPVVRRQLVIDEITKAVNQTDKLQHGKTAVDEGLVDTVTNLVEKPFGVCGVFDEKFLQLPPEVLITSMREHQKYFPVVDQDGNLMPGFVAVNNTNVTNPDITRRGHQRVLRARLEDALFFYNTDREKSLADRVNSLDGIIFQAKLGTMLEKTERLVKLVKILADKIDPTLAEDGCRAAELAKADLLTNMVGEFPTLQGIMGGAYALHDGEKPTVATAIIEQYMPKRSGAEIPGSEVGALLALADRFDTLAGCFGIGQIPTGTADPFGLRRISLGIIHIIKGNGYTLSFNEILHKSLALYGNKVAGGSETVLAALQFLKGRFINDCITIGYDADVVDAVVSVTFDDVNDCMKRIEAIQEFRKDPVFKVLSGSFKRIRNIIKNNQEQTVRTDLFEHQAEKALYQLSLEINEEIELFVKEKAYASALSILLKMKEPVDMFFNDVMVMVDNAEIRGNRLNLLTKLATMVLKIGDLSVLQEG